MPHYGYGMSLSGSRTSIRASSGGTSSTLLTDLLAYWKLDDQNWLDSTANGKNLTALQPLSNGTGIINGDAVFGGSADGLYNYLIAQGDSLSCSIWVKAVENASGGFQAVVGNWNFNYGQAIGLSWVVNIDPTGHAVITTAKWSDETTGAITSGSTLQVGWNHICFAVSPATNAIYLNGTKTTGSIPTMDLINDIIEIGFQSRDGLYFDGELDEVGLWNRVLSDAEVASLYNSGSARTYPFS